MGYLLLDIHENDHSDQISLHEWIVKLKFKSNDKILKFYRKTESIFASEWSDNSFTCYSTKDSSEIVWDSLESLPQFLDALGLSQETTKADDFTSVLDDFLDILEAKFEFRFQHFFTFD
jgi:hypothetical protein